MGNNNRAQVVLQRIDKNPFLKMLERDLGNGRNCVKERDAMKMMKVLRAFSCTLRLNSATHTVEKKREKSRYENFDGDLGFKLSLLLSRSNVKEERG